MTMPSKQCHATLEEVIHGSEHGVILRLPYRYIAMVLPDYLDASRPYVHALNVDGRDLKQS